MVYGQMFTNYIREMVELKKHHADGYYNIWVRLVGGVGLLAFLYLLTPHKYKYTIPAVLGYSLVFLLLSGSYPGLSGSYPGLSGSYPGLNLSRASFLWFMVFIIILSLALMGRMPKWPTWKYIAAAAVLYLLPEVYHRVVNEPTV